VRVDFTAGGAPQAAEFAYGVSNFVPTTATPAAVRAEIGAQFEEVPDADIDVITAYFDLIDAGAANDAALAAGGAAPRAGNRAVVLQAAVSLLPSLQTRLLQQEASNNASYARPKLDFDALRSDLLAGLQKELLNVSAALAGTAFVLPDTSHFLVTSPTDPVTGA
jgi:hypothetical protein